MACLHVVRVNGVKAELVIDARLAEAAIAQRGVAAGDDLRIRVAIRRLAAHAGGAVTGTLQLGVGAL